MTGTGLLKRILWVLAGLCTFLLFVAIMQSNATPIRPDIKKVLAQPQDDSVQFPLARAGWDGPEMTRTKPVNPTYEQLSPASSARAARASLIAAAIPDYRAVAGILLVILLLRRIRQTQSKRHLTAVAAGAGKAPVVMLPATAVPEQAGDNQRAA